LCRLPVIDRDHHLVGIIKRADLDGKGFQVHASGSPDLFRQLTNGWDARGGPGRAWQKRRRGSGRAQDRSRRSAGDNRSYAAAMPAGTTPGDAAEANERVGAPVMCTPTLLRVTESQS
jgi:hypothetical protein